MTRRWTADSDRLELVLDAESNDPLFFTRQHMGEITDAEFAELVTDVRKARRYDKATKLADSLTFDNGEASWQDLLDLLTEEDGK